MKRCSAFVLLVALLLGVVVADAPPALACTCDLGSPQGAVDSIRRAPERNMLFLGEQIAEGGDDSRPTQTFRIDRIYGGTYEGDSIETVLSESGEDDCDPPSFADAGVGAFPVLLVDGQWRLAMCGDTPLHPASVSALLEGLPPIASQDPPEFIVGQRFGPSLVATLDATGAVVSYGEGEGEVRAIAPCPGAQRVVLVVGATVDDANNIVRHSHVEVRSLPSLDLISAQPLNPDLFPRWDVYGPNGSPEGSFGRTVVDLECHDEEGSFATFLSPRWVVDEEYPTAIEVGGANAFVLRDETVAVFDVGIARSFAVNPTTLEGYTINGPEGQNLVTWDVGSQERLSQQFLQGVGWSIKVADEGVVILGRQTKLERQFRSFAIVNAVMVGTPENLTMHRFEDPAALVSFTGDERGFIAVLRNPNQLLFVAPDGQIQVQPISTVVTSAAVGSTQSIGTVDSDRDGLVYSVAGTPMAFSDSRPGVAANIAGATTVAGIVVTDDFSTATAEIAAADAPEAAAPGLIPEEAPTTEALQPDPPAVAALDDPAAATAALPPPEPTSAARTWIPIVLLGLGGLASAAVILRLATRDPESEDVPEGEDLSDSQDMSGTAARR